MRKLLFLSAMSLLTATTSGCFHNCCGPGLTGGLFARRPTAQATQCCQPCCPPPCCPQPCCDPCGGGGAIVPTTTLSPVMPTVPCCQ